MAIITSSDIITYCRASDKIPSAQFDRFIKEVEMFDIIPLIGYELFEDIINELDNSPALGTQKLADLYNGKAYQISTDTTWYKYEGLKICACYCAYKRLLEENSINLTAYGVVTKIDELSAPLTDAQMSMIVNKVNDKVIVLKEQVTKFICDFSTTYTEYKGTFDKRNISIKLIGD